ncbi:hypothetical protein KSS94_08180 [Pseudomonas fakonensis]|uniref:Uncharacterized protein n=1 Tax=Pseudomonas fakonensis TaxID=2842355 RepID=A0ABX8NBE5_9PSED|nr:hypothetical protein [Pseudomonas fakonensis]QXH53081.1 hypothetical protein KSS94_08180 [Pseudomonas fakonensis]
MDFITTGLIASSVYDILKAGLKVTSGELTKRLTRWLKEDVITQALVSEINTLGINDDMSEKAISERLKQSKNISDILDKINSSPAITQSKFNDITQNHSGNGDNIAGNIITINHK